MRPRSRVGPDFWATIDQRPACEFVLEEHGHERFVTLAPQTACIVPRGVWHPAIVLDPGEILYVTRGAGTERRSR